MQIDRHTNPNISPNTNKNLQNPPEGRPSVAPTRHWVPGIRILGLEGFFPFSGSFLLHLIVYYIGQVQFLHLQFQFARLG